MKGQQCLTCVALELSVSLENIKTLHPTSLSHASFSYWVVEGNKVLGCYLFIVTSWEEGDWGNTKPLHVFVSPPGRDHFTNHLTVP